MNETTLGRSLKVAVTIDDFVLWDGIPMPDGVTSVDVAKSLAATLTDYGLQGTYGFAHTFPLDKRPDLIEAFEAWVDAGHYLGNHTHEHAPLRWMSQDAFRCDFETAEKHIGHLIERAPKRYFRYPMDMSSGSESRRGQVQDFLAQHGYTNAPITSWFSDFAFIMPYFRAVTLGDAEVARQIRELHVTTAVEMLYKHADTARLLFDSDVPLIWLVHGTPVAKDTLGPILQAFSEHGVEFISLDEAMRHPVNFAMPRCAESFTNHLQRFALAAGLPAPEVEYERLCQIMDMAPMQGVDTLDRFERFFLRPMADRLGVTYDWDWS